MIGVLKKRKHLIGYLRQSKSFIGVFRERKQNYWHFAGNRIFSDEHGLKESVKWKTSLIYFNLVRLFFKFHNQTNIYLTKFSHIFYQQIWTSVIFIFSDTYIQKTRKSYMDSRARKNMNNINTELQDVHRIMVQNIDDVLQRGETLSGTAF